MEKAIPQEMRALLFHPGTTDYEISGMRKLWTQLAGVDSC